MDSNCVNVHERNISNKKSREAFTHIPTKASSRVKIFTSPSDCVWVCKYGSACTKHERDNQGHNDTAVEMFIYCFYRM